jgi:hypothetical protein
VNEIDTFMQTTISCARQQAFAEAMEVCNDVLRRFAYKDQMNEAAVAGVCQEAIRMLYQVEVEDLQAFNSGWECRQ